MKPVAITASDLPFQRGEVGLAPLFYCEAHFPLQQEELFHRSPG